MVSHWSLIDCKSPPDSWTLLSSLADLNYVIVRMVSSCLPISKSSIPCTNPLVTAPSAQITIGITVTFKFHSFFSFVARSKYFSLFLFSFSFTLWLAGTIRQVLFFIDNHYLVVWPRLGDLFVSQNPREFSVTDSGLYIYHLFVCSN